MRLSPVLFAAVTFAAFVAQATAADPKPEIARDAAQPQARNAVHTLRQIPEACARLEGMFTGQAGEPYVFTVVRTSPQCQPRARFVDAAKVKPAVSSGWILNDVIRVPDASCPSQQAVVRVWRKPGQAAPPKTDAQGRSRIYLEEQRQAAKSGNLAAVSQFAAQMAVEGQACR